MANNYNDLFDLYYKNAMRAKDEGNLALAKVNLLNAAKMMMNLAQDSQGELKVARFERANRLLSLANNLTAENINEPSSRQAGADNPPKNQNLSKSKNSSSGNEEDEDGTQFKATVIPNISFDDVAGLQNVKDSVKHRIIQPLEFPELYKMYNKQIGGGILMYGLPGTGKTMIAKAIAHEVGANYYEVLCSDIVSKWFGEAEKNIKRLFDTARADKRAVIFFDEFEAIGVKRGGNSTVMNRIVPELLAQMQGFKESDSVLLVVAATNRPWDIDSALLRPGRFNELLYIALPDYEARLFMVTKALKNIPMSGITAEVIAQNCEGFNGADVVELCERLKTKPLERAIATKEHVMLPIELSDYEEVIMTAKSSVTAHDIKRLEEFEKNRC